jgi:hypothetical protein
MPLVVPSRAKAVAIAGCFVAALVAMFYGIFGVDRDEPAPSPAPPDPLPASTAVSPVIRVEETAAAPPEAAKPSRTAAPTAAAPAATPTGRTKPVYLAPGKERQRCDVLNGRPCF